jgi:hypothetical protein
MLPQSSPFIPTLAVACYTSVFKKKEKRATVLCKVEVPITSKQRSVGLQQLQRLVCVEVGYAYAAGAAADWQGVLAT